MTVFISSDAEEDLVNGYWFYERQSLGLGDYFRSFLIADIDSLQKNTMTNRNKPIAITYLLCLFFVTFSLIRWNYPYIFSLFSPVLFHKRISVISLEILFAAIPFIAIYFTIIRSISVYNGEFCLVHEQTSTNAMLLRMLGMALMGSGLLITVFTIGQTIIYIKTANWMVMFSSLWKLMLVGLIIFEMSRLIDLEDKYSIKQNK